LSTGFIEFGIRWTYGHTSTERITYRLKDFHDKVVVFHRVVRYIRRNADSRSDCQVNEGTDKNELTSFDRASFWRNLCRL